MAEGHVKAVIPVGMPYWSIPLRPKAMHTWGSQLGPQNLPGPYWSGPRQCRSRSCQLGRRSGSYWSILGCPKGCRTPEGRHWAVLVHAGVSPDALWGSMGFQGVYTSPGGSVGPPRWPPSPRDLPTGIYGVSVLLYRSPEGTYGSPWGVCVVSTLSYRSPNGPLCPQRRPTAPMVPYRSPH